MQSSYCKTPTNFRNGEIPLPLSHRKRIFRAVKIKLIADLNTPNEN